MDRPRTWRPPVQVFSFRYLVIIPVLLAVGTAVSLWSHSDTNLAMLYSQCHAHSRIPALSRIKLIGTPSCYLISFFQFAIASARSFAVMAVVLSYVGGLLTIYTIESTRICNTPNVLIAYPTGPLLVFNLIGGAIVWELLIIPAFLYRVRLILATRRDAGRSALDASPTDPNLGKDMRNLVSDAETVAIPAAVALGFILPSVLMLVFDTPVAIGVWLFFPIYVSAVRKIVRFIMWFKPADPRSLHLESHRASMLMVYAGPVFCSALSHGLLIYNLFKTDDREEMTRAALRFIVIDMFYVGLTVLYWLFVEVGWKVVGVMVAVSFVLGPGAGVCAGWIYRENTLRQTLVQYLGDDMERRGSDTSSSSDTQQGEETPLLR